MDIVGYQEVNESFKTKFIYRLGGWTGFFSEYNNMVLAMHFCLVNHIQFVLESEGANFSSGKGWTEFFLPFSKEIANPLLKKYNHRIKPTYSDRLDWCAFNIYKRIHPRQIYMYSLFKKIREIDASAVYCVPELGLKGSLLENCSEIHKMIWRYNYNTEIRIRTIIDQANLPSSYIGLHIRQGDKCTESQVYEPGEYMRHALKFSSEKKVFVLTDDYNAIIELQRLYPEYEFFTFCNPSETGYDYQKLKRMSISELLDSFIRLWASMDVLEKSILFVGTYSANPGMNMGFRMCADNIKCLDFQDWQLW